jgi:VIT1/CCC1 family predicted Fe2+/Mn2+ transporter
MDGSVSTLAPVFAAAMATMNSWDAFLVGMAASLGAGISMGFAEALSDDGSLTGRGHPWVRGLICGAMTTLGGIGHTLPFLIPGFQLALGIAMVVVLVELGVITWVRHKFMDTPVFSAACRWVSAEHSCSLRAFSSEGRNNNPRTLGSHRTASHREIQVFEHWWAVSARPFALIREAP